MSQSRMQTWLIAVFAGVALALAALGIYGVMSYSVAQATHDMGIRIALGASAANVLKIMLGKGLLLTAAGLLVGIAGALLSKQAAVCEGGVEEADDSGNKDDE